MRLHATSNRHSVLRLMTIVIAAAGVACESDPSKAPDDYVGRTAANDSLTSQRTELVSDLQKRILDLLATSPNAPTAGVYMGAPGDTAISINIGNDTTHIAPRLVLENPPLVRQLRAVGYRAVSFRDRGRVIVLPFPSSADSQSVATAPSGLAGEVVRRAYADSIATRLRGASADARARGVEREILYVDGLAGSGEVAFSYANALSGGMLSIERLRALRFKRLIVAGPTRSWCWNLTEMSGPTACPDGGIQTRQ